MRVHSILRGIASSRLERMISSFEEVDVIEGRAEEAVEEEVLALHETVLAKKLKMEMA